MSDSLKILVFHRNCLFRDCLAAFLSKDQQFDAIAVDHSQKENVWEDIDDSIQVVLIDLNLPDNIAVELASAVRARGLQTKVVALVPDEHDRLVECIAAGVHGCVLERSSVDDLRVALSKVLAGETFCSQDIVATMFAEVARYAAKPRLANHFESPERPLTLREKEVLKLLEQRKSNKEIASALSVSLFTVKNHVHNILHKLQVDNRQDAVHLMRRHQIVR